MTVEVGIFILVLAVLFGTGISILVSTLRTGSPPTPSGPALRREITAMAAKAEPGPGAIYELGSGWGGLAHRLARAHPDRAVIGLESSLVPWCAAVVGRRLFGPPNLRFGLMDFSRADLSDAAMVVCYLSGDTLRRVSADIEGRLPDGCVIVSATFAWPGSTPVDRATARDLFRSPVYMYRIERRDGSC